MTFPTFLGVFKTEHLKGQFKQNQVTGIPLVTKVLSHQAFWVE